MDNTSMVLNLNISLTELPQCPKCKASVLLPFPDESREGKSILLKAWVCANPDCHYGLQMKSGSMETVQVMKGLPPRTL